MKRINTILVIFVTATIGFVVGVGVIWGMFKKLIRKDNQNFKKLTLYYHILNQWVSLKQKKKTVVEYFERNNYKTVAIYGMKELGELLLFELENSEIDVRCIIDQDPIFINKKTSVLHPDDIIPDVDVIVVTASYYFREIEKKMKQKINGDVVSIDDVVFSEY